jgi:hypothetical protein
VHFVSSFIPLLAVLLANQVPITYIKNKSLLNLALKYASGIAQGAKKTPAFAKAKAHSFPLGQLRSTQP